jgi:hypothetical protein
MSAPGLKAAFVRVFCHVAEVPLPDIAVSESAGLPIPNLTLLASCGVFLCRQCMIEGPALGAFAPSAADDV